MTSIALIDDHPMLTNTLGAWLEATGRISVAGTAKNLTEARTLIESLDPLPHIIILDISLGKEDGLAFIPQLKKSAPKEKKTAPCRAYSYAQCTKTPSSYNGQWIWEPPPMSQSRRNPGKYLPPLTKYFPAIPMSAIKAEHRNNKKPSPPSPAVKTK